MKLHPGLIIGPTIAFVATALIIRFESQECASCKLPKKVDKVTIGKKVDLPYEIGNRGALLVLVGECQSCAMKHVDRQFLARCNAEGFKVTFVESAFNKTRIEPVRTSFEGMPVITVSWILFQELTTSFLPRLLIVGKDKLVLVKQKAIGEPLVVPSG